MNPIKLFFYIIIFAIVYLGFDQINLILPKQKQSTLERIEKPIIDRNFNIQSTQPEVKTSLTTKNDSHNVSCKGHTHCSHMHSCEEAIYYLKHCPDAEMDGDMDGIPCERQWCNMQQR